MSDSASNSESTPSSPNAEAVKSAQKLRLVLYELQAKLTPGGLPEETPQDIESQLASIRASVQAVRKELPATKGWLKLAFLVDEDLIVLHGHTLLERSLSKALNAYFVTPCNFESHFRDYATQLRMAVHIGLLKSEEYQGYLALYKLRNGLAHGTKVRVTVADEAVLRHEFRRSLFFRELIPADVPAESFPGSLKMMLYVAGLFLEFKALRATKEQLSPLILGPEYVDAGRANLDLVKSFGQIGFGLYTAAARAMANKLREFEAAVGALLDGLAGDQLVQWITKIAHEGTTPGASDSQDETGA